MSWGRDQIANDYVVAWIEGPVGFVGFPVAAGSAPKVPAYTFAATVYTLAGPFLLENRYILVNYPIVH